jgi:hypothetical protein
VMFHCFRLRALQLHHLPHPISTSCTANRRT